MLPASYAFCVHNRFKEASRCVLQDLNLSLMSQIRSENKTAHLYVPKHLYCCPKYDHDKMFQFVVHHMDKLGYKPIPLPDHQIRIDLEKNDSPSKCCCLG